jgi:hypothetical protein
LGQAEFSEEQGARGKGQGGKGARGKGQGAKQQGGAWADKIANSVSSSP